MNKIEPGIGISRRYLHDEVAERMRELIRSGEMEPKARINEGELTERFGISRTPLREAIKILATEGLLELLPNRGARVASISDTELEEMMEVIAGLEATAGDLACRTISEAEIDAIADDHAAMGAAWKLRRIVMNVRHILAIELMCAAQGLDFRKPLRAGRGAAQGHRLVRELIAPLERDRVLSTDITALASAIERGHFTTGVGGSA